MWFLITFEDHEFIRIITKQGDTEFKYEGDEDNQPVFSVSDGMRQFEVEVLSDNTKLGTYLTNFHTLSSSYLLILNPCTVLLKWTKGVDSLKEQILTITHRTDKYAIFPVTEIVASNFLELDFVNRTLKL